MKIFFKQFLARQRILAQAALCGIFLACGSGGFSQTVTTIAGGRLTPSGPDNGFKDGNSRQEAQFNFPAALAIGFDGRLYVADKTNNAIRRLDLSANQTITIITNLNAPVGVLFDSQNIMYVLTQGDGKIHQFDTNYNYLGAVNTNGDFALPTAFCMDGTKNFYVTESVGTLKKVNTTNGTPEVITNGFNNPQGVAILDNGLIAVSDTGNHAIKVVNQFSSSVTVLAGGNGRGFSNGAPAVVKFDSPHGIVKAPNGALIVADRFNHRVRLVQTNGYTTTIYGIDPLLWEYCPSCNPPVYEGWSDGVVSNTALDPAAREPIGIAVSSDGSKIYSTEVYYHIIREVSGINLSGGGTGGTNGVSVPAPSITPDSGYYPNGIKITVNSTVADVFYTTDGSEPTTNSARVQISGNTGSIYWAEGIKDLTWLKVKAFLGTNSSATVSGKTSQLNLIGIPRDVKAGQGSTILVPIVVSLRSGERLRSIQFLAQVTPDGSAPVVSDQFRLLNVSTNDFIPVVAPAMNPQQPVVMSYSSLLLGNSRTLVVTAIGTNANFEVSSYAVVGMLVVPIPSSAGVGDTYTIQISTASGTSDGLPTSTNNVNLALMEPRKIIITNIAYTVGDTAGAGWYEAGEFGDGKLLNNDVLNAFYASLGIKAPPAFTDLFDAMDAFPDDEPGVVGGDGDIRFLDWQRILYRSLGLYTNTVAGTNWTRTWVGGGLKTNNVVVVGTAATSSLLQHGQVSSGQWRRDGRVGALSVNNAVPGSYVSVPVYAQAAQGCAFYGLQFRAVIIPSENAPLLSAAPEFVASTSAKPFTQTFGNDQLVIAWGGYGIGELFATPIVGSNLLGCVRFLIPAEAKVGDYYLLRFKRSDSGYGNRQFELETIPSQVAVLSQASPMISLISDEWRTNFFGSVENRWSEPESDPDGDNVPNWLEFQRGTNPVELRFMANPDFQNPKVIRLKWFGRNNVRYGVETADRLSPEAWRDFSTINGADGLIEIEDVIQTGTRFYRITVK